MINLESLKNIRAGMQTTVTGMQTTLDTLFADIERVKNDNNKYPQMVEDQVNEARKKALASLGAKLQPLSDLAEQAAEQNKYWKNSAFLLSQQKFSADPVADATIRLARAAELAAMDSTLLTLTWESAVEERDLPTMWLALIARGPSERIAIDLEGVVIPDQADALAAITACGALSAEAEFIAGQASGTGMNPVRKLELGRAMQPNAPTQHNSPGRAA